MMADGNPTSVQDLKAFVETTMQNLQGKFQAMSNQIVSRMDEMGTRIDDLEKNVSDLMTLAGIDEPVEDGKVEKLLEVADFGPQENTGDSVPIVNDRRETSISSNLFGIDHEALNRQIMEHKKRSTEKLTEPIYSILTEQQQELLAEMRKKKTIKKKKAKYNFDDDITPETYLLEKYNQEEYTEERDQLENQLKESVVKEMMAQEDRRTR